MGVFTHRTFSTEKPLHRTVFTHVFLHKKHLTQRKLYTQIAHRSFYRPTFLHAETSPGTGFTQQFFFSHTSLDAQEHIFTTVFTQKKLHRKFSAQKSYAQKSYAQKVLRTASRNIFLHTDGFTQMCLHRHKLHTETCAHSTRLHTANFYTGKLCFPFLITYLSCSPSQVNPQPTLNKH